MDDPFGEIFGPGFGPRKPTPEKGVQLHAKVIDGKAYIAAEDVVELLKINGLLPGIRKLLEQRIAKG